MMNDPLRSKNGNFDSWARDKPVGKYSKPFYSKGPVLPSRFERIQASGLYDSSRFSLQASADGKNILNQTDMEVLGLGGEKELNRSEEGEEE